MSITKKTIVITRVVEISINQDKLQTIQGGLYPEGVPDYVFVNLAKEIACDARWNIYADCISARPADDRDADCVPATFTLTDYIGHPVEV